MKDHISPTENDKSILTPSLGGKDCKCNGKHKGIEIQCDECCYYLICFPEYKTQRKENNSDY